MTKVLAAFAVIGILAGPLHGPSVAADNPLEIDAIVSMTGNGAFLGKTQAAALQLVEQNTNKTGGIAGRPIHFAVSDDQSNPQVAVQLATDMIARKVPVILGPTLTAGCNAVRALLKSDGPVLYCFTPGSHPEAGSYAFVALPSTVDLAIVNVRYFHDHGWKKVAMLSTTDASGQDGDAALDTALKRPEFADMSLVDEEHYGVTDPTVAAQLSRIKASGAQALFAWGTGTPIGTVFRGISDLGVDMPVAVSAANLVYPVMKQYANILPPSMVSAGVPCVAVDSIAPGPLHDAVKLYVDSFKAQGVDPDVSQADAWDPALIVVSAFKKLGPNATAPQIKQYISTLHGFAAANGIYDFRDGNQRGLNIGSGIMLRWDAAKNTWVAISKFARRAAQMNHSNDFAHTGPGTLAGRFLRGFWQPVYHLKDLPAGRAVPIRIMGENFTLYRGEDCSVHTTAFRCPHRGMQLSAGWVEGNSLRCFYHGWKYDASGQCVEQPAEERSFADKVQLRTYPTEEHLGLIFAYLGEGEPPPLPRFPEFEAGPGMFEWSSYVRRCNYFQNIENSFDNSHVGFVHRGHGDAYNGLTDRPIITTTENEWGIAVNVRRVSGVERTTYFGMPNVYYMYALAEEGERGWIRSIMWWVPIDDTSHVNYWVRRLPLVGAAAAEYTQRAASRQQRRFHGDVADDVLSGRMHRLDLDLTQTHMVNFQDDVAEVGQGEIADREHERLGPQDEGIIFLRKIWSRELRALAEGTPLTRWERPPGLVPTPRDQAELLVAKGR